MRLQITKLRVNLPVEHGLQACHPRVDADAARQALRARVSRLAHTGPKSTMPGFNVDRVGSGSSLYDIHHRSARHRDLLNTGCAVKAHSVR